MNKTAVTIGGILGIIFIIIGIVYATHSAQSLPHFFPGYDSTSSHTHVKHSIAAFVLAVASFIYAWFQSGPKTPR